MSPNHGNIGIMNAVSYLVSRKTVCPYKISAGLFLGSVLSWLNFSGAQWLSNNYGTHSEPLEWLTVILLGATGMAYCASLAGTGFGAPLHHSSQMNATLKRFAENRILDELTSTGLSVRTILAQLTLFHLKRVAIVTIPSTLLWILIFRQVEVALVAALIFLTLAVGHSVAVCLNCWRIAVGSRGKLFLVAPLVFLFGPPTILFQLGGGDLPIWLLNSLYLLAVSYYLSIRALESRNEFQSVTSNLRRIFRLKRKSSKLSENAIVARQEAVGREWGDVMSVTVSVLALAGSMSVSLSKDALWPVLNVLVLAGFLASWRAAGKLSQCLTSEMEGSTLEILRTTPLGSKRFLDGWLDLTLRPLFVELGLLSTAALGFTLAYFPSSLLDGTCIFAFLTTLTLPYLGALFGASIAGQLKTRREVAGQLTSVFLFCGIFTIPQVSMLLILEETIWYQTVFFLGLAWAGSRLMKAGATKSLNRVFLPQK